MEFIPLPPGYYSDSQVRQFIGWLSGDIKELHTVEVPKLVDSWERFKVKFAADTRDEHG
jgi:hypothetical protein